MKPGSLLLDEVDKIGADYPRRTPPRRCSRSSTRRKKPHLPRPLPGGGPSTCPTWCSWPRRNVLEGNPRPAARTGWSLVPARRVHRGREGAHRAGTTCCPRPAVEGRAGECRSDRGERRAAADRLGVHPRGRRSGRWSARSRWVLRKVAAKAAVEPDCTAGRGHRGQPARLPGPAAVHPGDEPGFRRAADRRARRGDRARRHRRRAATSSTSRRSLADRETGSTEGHAHRHSSATS